MAQPDLYKTLGVDKKAPAAEIKKAYRKLAKKYHPDVTGNDKAKTAKFKDPAVFVRSSLPRTWPWPRSRASRFFWRSFRSPQSAGPDRHPGSPTSRLCV